MANDDDKYLVLCCDGGGIRGLVTALLLEDLGQSLVAKADLLAGTSTGSYVALALASGMSVEELVAVYKNPQTCKGFFTPYEKTNEMVVLEEKVKLALGEVARGTDPELAAELGAIESLLSVLLHPLYSNQSRIETLEKILPIGVTIGEIWPHYKKRVLVTTIELDRKLPASGNKVWAPVAIHNLPNLPASGRFDNLSLVDAVMCCSSAPLYFEAWKRDDVYYADGGLCANNPSTWAITSLFSSGLLEAGAGGARQVFCLSVGTGYDYSSYPIPPSLATLLPSKYPWGILGWMWPFATKTTPSLPLVNLVFDATLELDTAQCAQLLGEDYFRRANVWLDQQSISLDDCAAIPQLEMLTREYIATPEWQAIKAWVASNFG